MELPVAKIELPAEIPSSERREREMMRTYCIIHQAERNYREGEEGRADPARG